MKCWKDKLNFKIHDVTTWLTNNAAEILTHISRSKVNQKMKFSQVIKYNKGNIFLKKYTENEVGRLISDFFLFSKLYIR